jgi:periplasmic protein CpxP/Spy
MAGMGTPTVSNRWSARGKGVQIMRVLLTAMAVSALLAGSALAEDTTASPGTGTTTGSSNAAVNGTGNQASSVNASGTITVVSAKALEKGANSFTENQARSRIESAGFAQLTGLHKDDQGIWRGKAMRDGKSVDVGFDYKGNIGAD